MQSTHWGDTKQSKNGLVADLAQYAFFVLAREADHMVLSTQSAICPMDCDDELCQYCHTQSALAVSMCRLR